MSRAYDHYIHTLLEPDGIIQRGNAKNYTSMRLAPVMKPHVQLTEEEDNKRQDEFLKRHGVPVGAKE